MKKYVYNDDDDDENIKYMATMRILITILIKSYNVCFNETISFILHSFNHK